MQRKRGKVRDLPAMKRSEARKNKLGSGRSSSACDFSFAMAQIMGRSGPLKCFDSDGEVIRYKN